MPKAIISNRIYMDLPDNKQEIFDKLTYRIVTNEGHSKFEKIELIRNYRMITPTVLAIPQGRRDLIPEGYDIVDKRIVEFADFPEPEFPLLPEQQVVYDEIEDSCSLAALPGWGKTFTALHLANKLGQKTLVVTHTAALRDQWVGEVEKMYEFTPSIIGAGDVEIHQPITIANVQTLVKHTSSLEKTFGALFLDEMHHVPATTFTDVVQSSHARYRIGLSGTMKRKDGKHVMFQDFFGKDVYTPPQNNTVAPTIRLLKTGLSIPSAETWADKITKLLSDSEYIEFIATIAVIQARKGHKVLVIADRIDFLTKVKELCGERAVVVVGETDDRDAEIAKIKNNTADILCGSRQIFSEGISVNELSCVILGTPIANHPLLEQIIGRIMRISPGKLKPEVIDIQFNGYAERKQNSMRIDLYVEKGWEICTD